MANDKDLEQDRTTITEDEAARPQQTGTADAETPVKEPPQKPPGKERRFRQTDLPAHFIERRKYPRIKTEPPPPPLPHVLETTVPLSASPNWTKSASSAVAWRARPSRWSTLPP